MSNLFHFRRRVEFRDTDMAGIVHFSVFFTYMEEAEHEFLRSLGLQVFSDIDDKTISWPRVSASCNYRNAIRFEDELDIRVSISRMGEKSLTYDHCIFRDDNLVAEGQITTVCCEIVHGKKPMSIQIPDAWISKLAPFVVV